MLVSYSFPRLVFPSRVINSSSSAEGAKRLQRMTTPDGNGIIMAAQRGKADLPCPALPCSVCRRAQIGPPRASPEATRPTPKSGKGPSKRQAHVTWLIPLSLSPRIHPPSSSSSHRPWPRRPSSPPGRRPRCSLPRARAGCTAASSHPRPPPGVKVR